MASVPQIIDCPEGEWTKFATDVVDAMVHMHPAFGSASYIFTYRPTGETAPDDDDRVLEGIPIFDNRAPHPVASRVGEGIDGYIWCENEPGRVILYN
jgi:hypothetical protein